jgi:dipeptidyl aminopeptidase/acylaminoacyl peptidase
VLLAKEVGSNMAEYFEYDPARKALTPLFGQGERQDYNAEYGASEGEVIVQTPKLGEFRRLYSWKAGKLTPISPELKFDVESFSLDRQKQRLLYNVNEGGYMRLRGMDAKTYKELKLPTFPPADHVYVAATTHNGQFTTFSVDTGKGPAQSYSLEWKGNKLREWHVPSSPEIDTSRFARATLEQYPARDGTMIPMFVRRPEKCDKPCPVVVDFHGGPEGQTIAGFSTYAQIFVDAGFVFAQPNVRGSDGYGKTWLHADDGPRRLEVITDIEDCARFIRKSWGDGGKEPKVGIMGGSYGGYSTLVGMTMFAGAYDAGAENVGFSSLVTFLQNTAPYRRPLRISEYGDPDKDREALIKLSPITYVDKIKAPLLLIQGANDPRVPVGEAVQVYRAMQAKKLPAKLMIFADEGHGAQKRGNVALTFGHMVHFFQEHLQGKKAP